jgi:hypothetical protein
MTSDITLQLSALCGLAQLPTVFFRGAGSWTVSGQCPNARDRRRTLSRARQPTLPAQYRTIAAVGATLLVIDWLWSLRLFDNGFSICPRRDPFGSLWLHRHERIRSANVRTAHAASAEFPKR